MGLEQKVTEIEGSQARLHIYQLRNFTKHQRLGPNGDQLHLKKERNLVFAQKDLSSNHPGEAAVHPLLKTSGPQT